MILNTKLHIPQPRRDDLIERKAITELLNEGLKCKLTTVTAPGGYGKTTALSQWLQQIAIPAAWISWGLEDNDLIEFWSYIIAAVNSKNPNFAEVVTPYLPSLKSGAFESFITALIQELDHFSDELVIVFDDYHVIDLAPIHASVAYFLAYLPAHIHLYVTSRSEMPFPSARLQATGQMVKITIQELRFQLDEGIRYYQGCLGLPLSGDEIANLVSRTEGWISGLHLAAISLNKSSNYQDFIHTFSGEHRSISDYLFQEAFSLQSKEIQSFLLETSLLNRMNAPLCETVTGQANCQELLEILEQQNLFIIPLDGQREWYRYHHLFSEFLRRLFRQRYAGQSKELHVKAAHWLEEHGFLEEAVEQLFVDGHHLEASDLIEKHLQNLHAKRGVLHRWLRDLPESCFTGKLRIQFLYVKVMVETNEMELAQARLRLMEDKLSDPEWKPYAENVHFLSAAVSFYRRDFRRANEYFEVFDRHTPEGSYVQMIEANSYSMYFDTLLSFFNDLHDAERFFYKWIKVWEDRDNYPYVGFFYNTYSLLLYEWNRLEEAEVYAERVLRSTCMQPYALILLSATVNAARIYQAKGDSVKAFDLLEGLKTKIHSVDKSMFMRRIEAEKAYLSLANGSFDKRWLQTCGIKHTDTIPLGPIKEYLILASVLMERREVDEALQLLEQLYRLVDDADRTWDKVKVAALQSIAFYQKGDMTNAVMKLEAALQLAEPGKYIRSFVDEGAKMAELLREYIRQRQINANRKSASVLYARELLLLMSDHRDETASSGALITKQELKILRMIDLGLSNKQIAEQLQITAETVKSHLKSIYRKLDVNSREQALRQGKELKLL
ncbi:LuxR C-terminal-related transcriptional regulator [Paenibacillus sp. HWE-109]|uniref:LuxR C-terminal-related transcriptional regulator n=1 Tax=Paenibacillus sp. HWE-109 TaxID=1306526 RepID=UPI001EE080AE|nr:LuxR C-terminal-related transcriptional regulator [Paenibacillus sp. HWE-109]UKS26304.1 LuxR C-terminal-related transcriptional regulator [Paenibacillus sp. HWE-109]